MGDTYPGLNPMYRGGIPCITIQSSILRYCEIYVSVAETRSGCTTGKNFHFFFRFFKCQFWSRVRFCMTRQKSPSLPGFLRSGLCDPSDIARLFFCNNQLIWSYSQKPLTFSSFTASNTYTLCISTLQLYMFDFD